MKRLFIFLLYVFPFCRCFSQKIHYKKDSSLILNTDYIQYKLESDEKSNLSRKLPFSRITFFDARYDTSFIAINWQVNKDAVIGNKKHNKKFNLTGGLAAGLTNYFNEYYKDDYSGSNAVLWCYVKKFAVTLKDTLAEYWHADASINTIKLEVECYYKQGSLLFPAIRLDTTYVETISGIKKTFMQVIKDIINPLVNRFNNIDPVVMVKRKSYTEEQIKNRYQSRFNIPVLVDDRYKKGVYKNFEEFRNNAPSITNFKIKTDRIANLLYDSAGNLVSSQMFGYCDGLTCWVQYGAYYFPLVRVGNAFEFFYTYYIRLRYSNDVIKLLLALNMETGKID